MPNACKIHRVTEDRLVASAAQLVEQLTLNSRTKFCPLLPRNGPIFERAVSNGSIKWRKRTSFSMPAQQLVVLIINRLSSCLPDGLPPMNLGGGNARTWDSPGKSSPIGEEFSRLGPLYDLRMGVLTNHQINRDYSHRGFDEVVRSCIQNRRLVCATIPAVVGGHKWNEPQGFHEISNFPQGRMRSSWVRCPDPWLRDNDAGMYPLRSDQQRRP